MKTLLVIGMVCFSAAMPPLFAQEKSELAKGFAAVPIPMTVKQRSTTTVPDSGDALRLTIGDITRGQVEVSLSTKDGAPVLAPVSLGRERTARFKYANAEYVLRLTKLSNALIGEDHAAFVIAEPASAVLSEDEKIERLLEMIEKMEGVVFIRNGTENGPKDAALHLRGKWLLRETPSAGKFIEDHATRSSESGELYQMRLPNGKTVPVGEHLRERLAELERAR